MKLGLPSRIPSVTYHGAVRIVSLLPSATETVCALGGRDDLVGRSHECDFPPGLETVPVLTRARVGPLPSSGAIHAAVRDVLERALGVYEIDVDRLREARPDAIVTQDLCEVCAVSIDDVRAAVARLARRDVDVVSLHPVRLSDIWGDIGRVAVATGRADAGRRLVGDLEGRAEAIRRSASEVRSRPTVLSIEWLDPVMIGGMWMPELVAFAGGAPLVTRAGDHASTLTREQLAALDPDVVLVKPCGFDLARTLGELSLLREALPWRSWSAVAEGRIYVADGSAFFNRPGPRIVESLEILAACLHPRSFAELAAKHAMNVVRLGEDLRVHPLG